MTSSEYEDPTMSAPVPTPPNFSSPPGLPAAALSVLAEGVVLAAADGVISAVNPAFCHLVRLDADAIVGRSLLDPPWLLDAEDGTPIPPDRSPIARALYGAEVTSDAVVLLRTAAVATWIRVGAGPTDPERPGTGAVMAATDLTAVMDAEHNLRTLMFTDTLTSLSSRDHITQRLAAALEACRSGEGGRVGVLHVDLDGFRTINDTFGPTVGDVVLVEVAERLRDLIDGRVGAGRVGVDEFLLMVQGDDPGLEFDGRIRRLAEEVQRRIAQPIHYDGLELHLTGSIGAARAPDDATGAVELMAAADRAVRTSRARGRNQFHFHDTTVDIRNRNHFTLDRDLRMATARRELEVYYQPIVDLHRGTLAAAEALVRWHHPELGPVSPSTFIPTAEATGSIAAISDFVLHTVASDLADWDRSRLFPAHGRIAVNISAAEFNRRDFLDRLGSMISSAGLDPHRLELEITEGLLVDDLRAAADRLRELDRRGIRVALDDFGTGYSSLSYLHHLPLHTLKIDRRFVGDLRDERSGTITRTIVSLAHSLGVVAVAEGVENDDQRRFLTEAGCDLAQGFLIAPPLPRSAFDRFLRDLPHGSVGAVGASGLGTAMGDTGMGDIDIDAIRSA